MRIFLLGNGSKPRVREVAEELLPFLRMHCQVVIYDLAQQADLSLHEADIALVLGGDGAILRAARQMGYRQIPVLGVNLGKLGFLADLSPEEVRTHLPAVLAGNYSVTRHLMFECLLDGPGEPHSMLGLNEIVVRSGTPHLVDIDLSIDDTLVARFSGDGLILSTPVGSTAHSLSAGGPILRQDLEAFVITPICPHALTFRPLVDGANRTYTIQVLSEWGGVLIVDGQHFVPVTTNNRVIFRRAPVQFQLIKVPGHGYYQTLRTKLHWGTSPGLRHDQTA
ncbi:MAG: NAD(+)/NADH kinase [Gemmatales bacterium]|nr:NAD(+)/NADH kinase [Gemmatales bacterium]MDW8387655.1 NAD(+)/NADH kinase [Gemmatales bacterium]